MKRLHLVAPAVALAVVLAAAGCGKTPDTEAQGHEATACACPEAESVVDPALLAFLSKARAAHHEADLAEDGKDLPRAIAAVERITTGPRPVAPEVAEVIADARARLADLRSRKGDTDEALRDVEAGLALAAAPTHFRGHLFEVKGVVLERRLEALKQKGDAPGAERVKKEAIEAFDEAIEIQNKVIEGALGDAGKGGGGPSKR